MTREVKLERIEIPLLREFRDREKEGAKSELEATVAYVEGGTNYATGNRVARGYYAKFFASTMTPDGARMFVMFGGINKGFLIEEAKRFDARKLAKLAETAKGDARYAPLRAECLAMAGVETAAA